MSQNQKNQAMVDAFGSGKPPVMSIGGKVKEKRGGRQRKSDNSDIDAIFRGIRSTRGMVRRGLSGEILNPDGTDPGNSFDRFMRQNPHLKGASQRQVEYDQQRQKPVRSFLPGQSSPPGGASGAMVGAPQSSGNPGGETLFGSVPEFKSAGMRLPAKPMPIAIEPNDGSKPDWNSILGYGANTGPQTTMGPNSGPQLSMGPNEGPQLQYGNPAQIEALRTMNTKGVLPGRMSNTGTGLPTAPSRMRAEMTNYFPGNDYDYLSKLFPGLSFEQILQLIENPAYASQLK